MSNASFLHPIFSSLQEPQPTEISSRRTNGVLGLGYVFKLGRPKLKEMMHGNWYYTIFKQWFCYDSTSCGTPTILLIKQTFQSVMFRALSLFSQKKSPYIQDMSNLISIKVYVSLMYWLQSVHSSNPHNSYLSQLRLMCGY